jgi:hypothetical protein
LTTTSQRREYSDAFIAPVVLTWESQFRRELVREDDSEEHRAPVGSLIGAILSISGTVQGFAVYYFDGRSAARAANEFGSRPITPGGDSALGAVNDIMRVVASNATVFMQNNLEAVEVRVGKIFACEASGLAGDEEWSGYSYLHTKTDERRIYGVDEAWVFVDLVADATSSSDVARKANAIVKAAQMTLKTGSRASVSARLNAAPPLPVVGIDEAKEFDELKATEIKARRFFVVDSEGRRRAALSSRDDGSTNVILADSDGRMRAAMAISNKGIARIMFIDGYGSRTFAAPPQTKPSKTIRRRGARLARRRMNAARTAKF